MRKYRVTTSKNNLQSLNHFNLKHLRVLGDDIVFLTDNQSLEKIKNLINVEYEDVAKKKLLIFLKKHLITILGSLLIVVALVNQSSSVVDIKFTNPDTYNSEIVTYMEKYYHRVGPFKYLNSNLTDINLDLRSHFYQYEWVGIRKVGSYLYFDIKEIVNPPIIEEKTPGSYYASKDGIVKKYHLEKGVIMVQEEQYVSKGDLLISGIITHYNNKFEHVRAKGYVIAEVLEYQDFKIPKETIDIVRSGRLIEDKQYFLFGKHLFPKKIPFESYNIEEVKLTRFLGNTFVYRKVYVYELIEVKTVYSVDEAVMYAKSKVIKNFNSQKTSDLEKIIFNNLVKIEEDDEFYNVRLIVKSYQNIAHFVPDFPSS